MEIKGHVITGQVVERDSYLADTGAANAYVVTSRMPIGSYTAGLKIRFKASAANTGASTINVNGLGVKTIKKNVSSDLAANDIVVDQIVYLVYDGTNFQAIGIGGAATVSRPDREVVFGTGTGISSSSNLVFNSDNQLLINTTAIAGYAVQIGGNLILNNINNGGLITLKTDRTGIGGTAREWRLFLGASGNSDDNLTLYDWTNSEAVLMIDTDHFIYAIGSGARPGGFKATNPYSSIEIGGAAWFNSGNQALNFRVDGTSDYLIFGESFSNLVGIGTNSISGKLHVHNQSADVITLFVTAASGGVIAAFNTTGNSGDTEGYRFTRNSANPAFSITSTNGDGSQTITLQSNDFSDARPRWLLRRTATNPSEFSIICELSTGSVLDHRLTIVPSGAFIINPESRDRDTIIRGDNDTTLFVVDAGTDKISIGTATMVEKLTVNGKIQSGLAGTTLGGLVLAGNTSGLVTVQTAAAAGTWSLTLPTTAGNSYELLRTNGSGVSTWVRRPRQLKEFFADALSDTSTSTLYSYTLPANTLTTNGDRLSLHYAGNITAASGTASVGVYLGGTLVHEIGTQDCVIDDWFIKIEIIRVDSDTIRYSAFSRDFITFMYSAVGEINSLNFASTIDIELKAVSTTDENLVAKLGSITLFPVSE